MEHVFCCVEAGAHRLSLPLPPEDSCPAPFEFQSCGSPCAGLCATHLSQRHCQDLPPCQPGCYCPKVSSRIWRDTQDWGALPNLPRPPGLLSLGYLPVESTSLLCWEHLPTLSPHTCVLQEASMVQGT